MKHAIYLLIIISFIAISCNYGKNEQGIVGTWKLIEFSNLDSLTNLWDHPFGKNPKGYFTYTSNNIVHLNISHEVPLVLPEDSLTTTPFVDRDFMNNSGGYFGTYALSMEESIVTHKVEGGSTPSYIGTDQPRPFIMKNDTLIIGDNETWRRVLVKVAE